MIEQVMIFALGFLVSGLLALLVLPAFWRRAMRLSRRRLEMLMPLSMTEVFAERDQLRAQAAVEQRRLERKVEALTQDRARHMSEIGRRAGIIADLDKQLASIDATERAKDAELRHAWAELGAMHADLFDTTARLSVISVEFDALTAIEQRLRQSFDEQRLEKAALETRIDSLQLQDHDLRQRLKAAQLDREEQVELARGLAAEREHLRQELQTAHGWREQLTAVVAEQVARAQELENNERHERRGRMRAEKELAITNKLLADAEAAMHFRPSGLHAAVEAARAVRAPDEASQADAPANGAALAPNGHDAAMGQDYGLVEPAPIENAAPLEGSVDDPIHVPRPMPERHIAAG